VLLGNTATPSVQVTLSGVLVDPTSIFAVLRLPGGDHTTDIRFDYGRGGVTRSSTGIYFFTYKPLKVLSPIQDAYFYQWDAQCLVSGVSTRCRYAGLFTFEPSLFDA
jgi:hypothetical protein